MAAERLGPEADTEIISTLRHQHTYRQIRWKQGNSVPLAPGIGSSATGAWVWPKCRYAVQMRSRHNTIPTA
jgi:hypothetical protein